MLKLNSTTWKHTAKDDKDDRLEVIIGDDKQPDFKPQIKIQRWDNEVNASFRLVDDETDTPIIKEEESRIKYIKPKKELHFYNIEPNDELREGGFEFEIILKEKPKSNKLEFTINAKGLKFYYQPPLTEMLKVGDWNGKIVKVTETHAYTKDEKTGELIPFIHGPEYVIGSYAVYHENKAGDYSRVGGKNYRVGKVFHIYRPKIIDANGNWIWGKLHIDTDRGILTITIDHDWLNAASLPLTVDPTFGYDTAGVYEIDFVEEIMGTKYNSPSDISDADSISVYTKLLSGPPEDTFKAAIYEADGDTGILVSYSLTSEESVTNTSPHWHHFADYSPKPSLSPSTDYFLVFQTLTWGYLAYFFDEVTGTYQVGTPNHPIIGDSPITFHDAGEGKFSVYCTYTAAGGEEATAERALDSDQHYGNEAYIDVDKYDSDVYIPTINV